MMRVVAGKARGLQLLTVPGDTTRPILDRVKTALFDILRSHIAEKTFLDVFAGSGSVGIEAISQGAAHCVFLDNAPRAVETIKTNLTRTRLSAHGEVRKTDAFTYLRNTSRSFDFIYLAPPQYKGIWLDALRFIAERPQLLSPEGRVIVQIDPKEEESIGLYSLQQYDSRRYGNTLLLFFSKSEEGESTS